MTVFALDDQRHLFPDPSLAEPDGLLAVGGDLAVGRLLAAYSLGIFPWYNEHAPILWWSPSPRLVLFPREIHVPRSLRRLLRKRVFRFSVDRCFGDVIRACAEKPRPGQDGTWILPEMVQAYQELHEVGAAHSIEVWTRDADRWVLAGGLYGVGLGSGFFGESMFYHVPDASKAALVFLAALMAEWDVGFIDCQQTTAHMLRFGAREISRDEFHTELIKAMDPRSPRNLLGPWVLPKSLEIVHDVYLQDVLSESPEDD